MQEEYDAYMDTEENAKILNLLPEIKSVDQAEALIDTYFPNWLNCILSDYSQDYDHLQRNWKYICQTIGTSQKKIVLVNGIFFDADHTVLNSVCEYMTRKGYIVRRVDEFTACSKCQKAIPCQEVWKVMKSKGIPCPSVWSDKCSSC